MSLADASSKLVSKFFGEDVNRLNVTKPLSVSTSVSSTITLTEPSASSICAGSTPVGINLLAASEDMAW